MVDLADDPVCSGRANRTQAVCGADVPEQGACARAVKPGSGLVLTLLPAPQITYDLEQLPAEQLLPLRDSLLSALRSFAQGPRVILTQICIALADMALQLSPAQWNDPVASMIDQFGKEPQMAAALLEFLQVLAEEYNSNFKIKVANDFGREGDASVRRGEQVIGLLSMYVQAQGGSSGKFPRFSSSESPARESRDRR